MKDTTSSGKSPTCRSSAAKPVAGTVPAEGTIWKSGTACSPRASLAFFALDAVRSALFLLSRLFRTQHGKGLDTPESHPGKKHEASSAPRPRKLWT
jgi:hypothetical protein